MKYIKILWVILSLLIFTGCDRSTREIGYLASPDELNVSKQEIVEVFMLALQDLPIKQIKIFPNRSNSYSIQVTLKDGLKLDEIMQHKLIKQLTDYQKQLLYVTDSDGAPITNNIKDKKEYYLLGNWQNTTMNVYMQETPSLSIYKNKSIHCVLTMYPQIINPDEINKYPMTEKNYDLITELADNGLVADIDKNNRKNLKFYIDRLEGATASLGFDLNGSLHRECWSKLKTNHEALYKVTTQARIFKLFTAKQ